MRTDYIKENKEFILGLATGNSPTGVYKHLAKRGIRKSIDS